MMKNILTIFLLTLAVSCFGQTYGWMLRIDPGQDADTANMGIVYPDGSANLTGRVHYVSYETVLNKLIAFSPDTVYVNTGDSLVIVSIHGDTTYFAGGGGAGVTDGDKGDITISSGGTVWTVDNGLAATKIADGTVSNAEFQYINSVTSNVQTQLGNKAASGANTDINSVVLDNTGLQIKDGTKKLTITSASGLSAERALTFDVNNGDRTITLEAGLHVVGAGSDAEISAGASVSGSNTGDQDLSGYATTGALALKVNISDTATMLANYPVNGEVVHKTGDESINGEKTFNDTLRVDDYALFKGLSGGLPTKIEALKDGTLQFNYTNESSGETKIYQIVQPLQRSEGNVPWISSIFTAANYGARWNDVHSMGWNMEGGNVLEAGKQAFGWVCEGYYQQNATRLRFEDHKIWYGTDGVQRRPESLIITDGYYDEWYKYFTTFDVFGLDPRNNYKYFQFSCDGDTTLSKMYLWSPQSANTKGAEFLFNATTNRLSVSPVGTSNTTFDVNAFPFTRAALIQRTEVAATYGLTMATIAGNTSDGYFGNIGTGWGIDLTIGNLVVDSSEVASTFDMTLKANDADVVHDTGIETIAGVKTFSSDPIVPDEAYDATAWNGSLEPPTKNAVRDKIETLSSSGLTFQQVYATSSLRL